MIEWKDNCAIPAADAMNSARPAPCWPFAVLAAAALLLIYFRLHAFDLPLETDECNYIYIAGRLLAGDRLYVDVWDHQPFGVFVLFAGVSALFGDAPSVFRSLALAFSLVSLGLIFQIVRRCAGPLAAAAATLMFALCSSDPGTAGEGCNREIYMNTLVLAAWYGALGAGPRRRWPWLAAGAALAAGSTIKTILAVHWLALAAWAVYSDKASRSTVQEPRSAAARAPSRWGRLAYLAAGPALVWAGAFAWFAVTNRWHEFYDAVFGFNLSYSGRNESFWVRFIDFFRPGSRQQPFVFHSAWPLWLAAVPALAWLALEVLRRRRRDAAAIVLLAAANYAAVCLPAQFWPHYYHLMIPSLVVAVAVAAERLWSANYMALSNGRARRAAGATLLVALAAWLAVTQYRHYLSQPPFGITVQRYNSRDFWGRAHGENIARVTDPEDNIFVYGNEASFYYYARRPCASRFTMITALRSGYAGHEARRRILLEEIRTRRPRLILVVLGEEAFPAWADFLPTRYDAVGWDFRDRPPHDPILMILCDRDRPIANLDWNWDRSSVGGWNLGEQR